MKKIALVGAIISITCFVFLLNGCSTRYVVSDLDSSYHAEMSDVKLGTAIITIPKDTRNNAMNLPNFDRTWGYLTDRGLYNNILSAEHPISADMADIIAGAFRVKGYDVKIAEPGDLSIEGTKVVEAEIKEFFVMSRCSGWGFFHINTSMNVDINISDADSHESAQKVQVTVYDKQTKGAISMAWGVKRTTEVFSQNLNTFKNTLLTKILEVPH